ncbi:UDP-N-acetylmuramoyl-L-alanyl-D-glutamate--2,6-diaminopimelate ligase [Virgibacillus halophilus]|uniref:UDP-N-acetylmuramoyl-L-alanyl-D-glutamate--2, 6-diaminopimelate ligase n=1 Tax=Tigheibacillus halophilus TaxID=361280 RepID=UPI00362A448F
MKLAEILSSIDFYETAGHMDENLEISTIEMDSRKVTENSLFVCIKGQTVDGHDFAGQAADKGASVILAERKIETKLPLIIVKDTSRVLAIISTRFYNNPTGKLPLIGITGTNGKTTVSYLLESIFNNQKKKTGVIGTIQMKIGDNAYPVQNTTPHALFLQKTFHDMLDQGVEQAIMEVSSHALDQGRVYGCDYDIAVFTNLSQDHLDYHKDMDDYLRAKSLLFAQLGNSYDHKKKYAVINADDDSCELLMRSTAQQVLTYACEKDADIIAENISLHAGGTAFKLSTPVGETTINSRLIGLFNVYNMLAACGAAIAAQVPLENIKSAFEEITGVNGRFEPVDCGQDFAVIVDYAHTPDSLENVLLTVKEFAKRDVYVVVGCGGDRDRGKRPLMAQIAVKYGDHVLFTSDNPRTEDPEGILADMTAGVKDSEAVYEVIVSREQAISEAVKRAGKDDVILIAGKGHETYQQIGLEKHHFDDREIAAAAIKNKER